MTRRLNLRVLGAAATLSLVATVPLGAAIAAPPAAVAAEQSAQDDMERPQASSMPQLKNSTTWTVQGRRAADGGCDFDIPPLELKPNESAVEVRQVGIDVTNCTTIYERGMPTTNPQDPSDGVRGSGKAMAATQSDPDVSQLSAATLYSSSGYTRGWQTDIVNLTVNWLRSDISWSYDYSCVRSSSGSYSWYYRSGSGWEPPYNKSSTISRLCTEARVSSKADFKNTGFCWPSTVYSYYRDIAVAGRWDGGIVGSVGGVSHAGNGGCAPLYDHWELKRLT